MNTLYLNIILMRWEINCDLLTFILVWSTYVICDECLIETEYICRVYDDNFMWYLVCQHTCFQGANIMLRDWMFFIKLKFWKEMIPTLLILDPHREKYYVVRDHEIFYNWMRSKKKLYLVGHKRFTREKYVFSPSSLI